MYGDVASFQSHILQDEYQGESIFKQRYINREKCLIVDEVDSMFLDNCQSILFLSHDIEALKSLEPLFLVIWATVLSQQDSATPEENCRLYKKLN